MKKLADFKTRARLDWLAYLAERYPPESNTICSAFSNEAFKSFCAANICEAPEMQLKIISKRNRTFKRKLIRKSKIGSTTCQKLRDIWGDWSLQVSDPESCHLSSWNQCFHFKKTKSTYKERINNKGKIKKTKRIQL